MNPPGIEVQRSPRCTRAPSGLREDLKLMGGPATRRVADRRIRSYAHFFFEYRWPIELLRLADHRTLDTLRSSHARNPSHPGAPR